MEKMKIIHAPIEISGQVGHLCEALNRLGHHTAGYNYFRTFHGYTNHLFPTDLFELMAMAGDAAAYFDLFHFHFSMSMMPDFGDMDLINRLGKPIIMHHWGNDVRMGSIASAQNPFVYTGSSPSETAITAKLENISRRVSTAIVQDYEVYAYVKSYYKNVFVLPLAVDLDAFVPSYPIADEKNPLIVHAPTDPAFKGTKAIETAIHELQQSYSFRYRRIEKLPHLVALALYRQADIIIDQILCGSYGMLSVEAMALGKPVVAYIRDDLAGTFPGGDPPICSANPNTLYDTLESLLKSAELRREKGRQGREYAKRYHDVNLISLQLMEIYKTL